MTYIPDSSLLCGLSVDAAECYGKPHIRAHYKNRSVKSHEQDQNARCAACGRPATNVHHNPPLSKGHVFNLYTPMGVFVLKPSLIALCGSGTTGCHDGFHGGARFKAEWSWDEDEYAERWWNGWFLSHGYEPHDKRLYRYGEWKIIDRMTGESIVHREDL